MNNPESKSKVAWIEDDNYILSRKYPLFYFKDLPENFDFDIFRNTSFLEDGDLGRGNNLDLGRAYQSVMTIPYDCIILDDMMMNGNVFPREYVSGRDVGDALLEEIRSKRSANRHTPVIMYISKNDNQRVMSYYKDLGANILVSKWSSYFPDDFLRDKHVLNNSRKSRKMIGKIENLSKKLAIK